MDRLARVAFVTAQPTAVTELDRPVGPGVPTTVVTTTDEALHDDEWRRMRMVAGFLAALALIGTGCGLLLGGDTLARRIHWGGNALVIAAGIWVVATVRERADYDGLKVSVFGIAATLAGITGFYYWGPLSLILGVVPFGAFIIAQGQGFASALIITLLCLVAHATMTLLIIFGAVEDRGLIQPVTLDRTGQITALLLAHLISAGAFALGRNARRSERTAIAGLERAVRALSVREALLTEAKQELERVMQAGGAGRYSEQVVGDFRLGNVIGRGGMGEVYEAVHVATGAEAAVKLLYPHVLADPDHIRRFLREVEIVSTLKAPEIVRVLAPPHSEGLPYLAMERLHGESLSDLLKHTPVMPLAEVTELITQVAAGLVAAHAAGIVHRDLKPHNLFRADQLDGPPQWKILDFGVCKLLNVETTLTGGRVVGTPAYMAPEQARGDEVDHRADIHSLSVIAYRALTGRPAFTGRAPAAVMVQVVGRMPPRPSLLADLPHDIDLVLGIGLAKVRVDRFGDAAELAAAFTAAAAGRLSDALRRHARALAERQPWERLTGKDDDTTID